jgi:hypothetical protein
LDPAISCLYRTSGQRKPDVFEVEDYSFSNQIDIIIINLKLNNEFWKYTV